MKKRSIFIVISVLLAVTLVTAFSAYAKPPVRATIYASIYEQTSSQAYRPLKIAPINNVVFGVYQDEQIYNTCQYLRLYFRFDVTSFSSFHFKIKRLTTTISDSSASLTSLAIDLIRLDSNLVTQAYEHIQSDVTATRYVGDDGFTYYEWTYVADTVISNMNSVMVFIPFQTFMLGDSPIYFETIDLSVNGESSALSYTDQKLDEMMNYDSQGGSPDTEGASEMVETIVSDVSDINNTIQSHSPHVQNWFETSPVATDLVNIALLANSWLPAYLNCDPDVSFYWGLVTFCILLTLIENGLRRRPWHGFDDGGDFESEYDVTSTDEKGRSRTIHNKVSGSRRRIR